ncbi:MAG: 16S rRNA (guanine(527)-N(7))-methyltransferase RsmG [Gammaproteobacteria bacterium]|nr:16S rRNA (guanine(527)-N(7))-methyltransferase RsmG [Gammaproteobacteria bacterium]
MTTATPVQALLAEAAAGYGVALTPAQLAQLERYIEMVMRWGQVANLTGAGTALAFAREQVIDSLAVVPYAGAGRLLDVGSGNGLPGVVLAIARPDLAVTLLEPRAKRARFLTQVRIELGLANVEVVCARVEHHRPRADYDTLIARAFAALPDFVAASRALRGPGTRLLAMKGQLLAAELQACALPAAVLKTVSLTVPGYAERHLVVIEADGAASEADAFVP